MRIVEELLFPCRCPFCMQVIPWNEKTCKDCVKYTKLPHKRLVLSNGCRCSSLYLHKGVWRRAVISYKYESCKQLYLQFSLMLKDLILDEYAEEHFDAYTSVPMHKSKLRERGFDHTKLLARETARLNGAQYLPLLEQTVLNKTQHTLSREERAVNVHNIFSCKENADVKGKHILLFDDIITTGATLSECCKALLEAGADKVDCVTINC